MTEKVDASVVQIHPVSPFNKKTMRYILTRAGKDGSWKDCECDLFVHDNRDFSIIFTSITEDILLNNGNFYSVNQINGCAETLSIDSAGVLI